MRGGGLAPITNATVQWPEAMKLRDTLYKCIVVLSMGFGGHSKMLLACPEEGGVVLEAALLILPVGM